MKFKKYNDLRDQVDHADEIFQKESSHKDVHKIAILHITTLYFRTPLRRANILFPYQRNTKIKS
jgi:hypothetical protein